MSDEVQHRLTNEIRTLTVTDDPQPRLADELEEPWKPLMRVAWTPRFAEGQDFSRPWESKCGGTPYLQAGEAWPKCLNCHHPMELLLQLNLEELPEAALDVLGFSSGVLQLFYCTVFPGTVPCQVVCEGWLPFNKCSLARIIERESESQHDEESKDYPLANEEAPNFDSPPPKRIIGWNEEEDYPTVEDAEYHHGVQEDWFEDLCHIKVLGDKQLCGWGNWMLSPDYPLCPICQQEMKQLVFQLVYMGVFSGFLTQCSHHRLQLAFFSQC